jgi:tripartite-type tricarboxylate transporter receptor subunit TctC
MKYLPTLFVASVFALTNLSAPASATTHDFYSGARIRFIVGLAPGGGFDLYTRLIARHFGKHVPGSPRVIVENMPGAGSMIAANHVYNVAKPDLTIGNFLGPVVLQHVIGNPAAKIDGRNFGWLGAPTPDSQICFVRDGAGVKTVEEWIASKRSIAIGATGPGAVTHGIPLLVRASIEVPIDLVSGYAGTSAIRAAIDRGELDGGCWAWESLKGTSLEDFQSGKYIALVQVTPEPHPELKNVPLAVNYAKTDPQRQILKVAEAAFVTAARPYAVPPGTAPERLQVLRKAFMDTLRDPTLRAEAEKARMDINPVEGATIARLMAELYKISPEVVATAREILQPGKK